MSICKFAIIIHLFFHFQSMHIFFSWFFVSSKDIEKNTYLPKFCPKNFSLFRTFITITQKDTVASLLRDATAIYLFLSTYFFKYSSIEAAAFLPSPIARITVAPPRTISPPANTSSFVVWSASFASSVPF